MLLLLLLHSITAPSVPCGARLIILGAIPPALKHLATVKLWLSQPHIDQIMQPARPVAQRCCIAHIRRVALQLLAQVACTLLAGVEVPQCQDEASHGVLLLQGGVVWVVRCHAVQQRPGGPANRWKRVGCRKAAAATAVCLVSPVVWLLGSHYNIVFFCRHNSACCMLGCLSCLVGLHIVQCQQHASTRTLAMPASPPPAAAATAARKYPLTTCVHLCSCHQPLLPALAHLPSSSMSGGQGISSS